MPQFLNEIADRVSSSESSGPLAYALASGKQKFALHADHLHLRNPNLMSKVVNLVVKRTRGVLSVEIKPGYATTAVGAAATAILQDSSYQPCCWSWNRGKGKPEVVAVTRVSKEEITPPSDDLIRAAWSLGATVALVGEEIFSPELIMWEKFPKVTGSYFDTECCISRASALPPVYEDSAVPVLWVSRDGLEVAAVAAYYYTFEDGSKGSHPHDGD